MATVRDAATGETASAATAAGARCGAELAGDFFDGDKSGGLFALPATDPAARSALLAAVDTRLPPEDPAAAEGATPDGRLTEDEAFFLIHVKLHERLTTPAPMRLPKPGPAGGPHTGRKTQHGAN
jgi:hypothetical protein